MCADRAIANAFSDVALINYTARLKVYRIQIFPMFLYLIKVKFILRAIIGFHLQNANSLESHFFLRELRSHAMSGNQMRFQFQPMSTRLRQWHQSAY